jgi:hypothetical protein
LMGGSKRSLDETIGCDAGWGGGSVPVRRGDMGGKLVARLADGVERGVGDEEADGFCGGDWGPGGRAAAIDCVFGAERGGGWICGSDNCQF